MLSLGILASTNGTDMQAIIDAIAADLPAKISVVISNKENAYALERARKHGLKTVFIDSAGKDREEYDRDVAAVLKKHTVDLVLLIGYMRFLSPWFVNEYRNKIMNIHPSLLPKYAGGMDKNIHEEVLKNKEKTTGATLHFVDEGADTGPIIFQEEVQIDEGETVDSLKAKVQKVEQRIFLKAIRLFDEGKIHVNEGRVVIQ